MTTPITTYPAKKLLWVSDLHLDQARDHEKQRLLQKLKDTRYDAVLLTGDISTAKGLVGHLAEISNACGLRPVFFTTGNHDYFGSSFAVVDQAVADLCSRQRNLIALGQGEIIELSRNTAVIGHRGWYDGQAGAGARTKVGSPDRYQISDFRSLSRSGYFEKLRSLGEESAAYFRSVLPRALKRYRAVLVATHVPPCTQALQHGGTYCHWERQPYFANRAAGNAIVGISRHFTDRRIVIHAGHTHCRVVVHLMPNLEIRVAGAQPGFPAIQEIVTID